MTFRFGFAWFPVALDSYKINYSGIGLIYSDLTSDLGEIEDNFRIADHPGTISPCDLGTRCLTAMTCKACASSPGRQEQRNFGRIGPPYGSIIRAMAFLCSMASKNLELFTTFAL